jgi:hypothetical protein
MYKKAEASFWTAEEMTWTSALKRSTRFSLTIPSEAAKKARTWEMK